MTHETETGTAVAKTLHMENAFVQSIDYTSASRPALLQTITVDKSITVGSYGRTLIRTSDDNGVTWTERGEWQSEIEKVGDRTVRRWAPYYHLEPDHGIVVEFSGRFEEGPAGDYASFGPGQDGTPPQARTGRVFYRISRDDGATWGPQTQLIQKGSGYDEEHWAEGIRYEKNGAFAMSPVGLSDGTVLLPICFNILGSDGEMIRWPDRFGTVVWPVEAAACFVGRWRDDMSDLDWELSNHVTVPEHLSRSLTEPAVAEMDDDTLMMVMRGSSGPRQTMTSVKFFSISADRGLTWGPAVPLTYPDCSYVYSPGSYLSLFRSAKNDRVYLVANILPEPTKHCDPRYPLKILEIDREYLWALPETETVIQDREERHGKLIRFSNWRHFEDRETGNLVIFMTEARADAILPDPEEAPIVPDAYRYEVHLPE